MQVGYLAVVLLGDRTVSLTGGLEVCYDVCRVVMTGDALLLFACTVFYLSGEGKAAEIS